MRSLRLCLVALLGCLASVSGPAAVLAGDGAAPPVTAEAKPAEAGLGAFLGEPQFDTQEIFTGERFPNVVVALDGSVIATWGDRRFQVRRSTDGGGTWEPPTILAEPGFQSGGAIVDETNGHVLIFAEEEHPPRTPQESMVPLHVFRSQDDGGTWQAMEDVTIHADKNGYVPVLHMADRGITLRHGEHAGRLLRPARVFGHERGENYNTALYSDDGGKTWRPSAPFPEYGTGEGTVAELADGRIYYNSRNSWGGRPQPTRRREAWSHDGGRTWQDWRIVEALPDGRQDSDYGCMAGLVRLPVYGRDILIYSNLDTAADTRERVTVWASFDGGATWPIKRLVHDGPGAYSSLAAGRPETPSEGWIYLQFEGGAEHMYEACHLARFNLAWLLQGDPTGDGELPDWLTP